ncbi:uncharacterized protein LOC131156713 [Malania oleifera]|uniref:uncharacterized protein LOC131156713 n=1 Tax=Malania oleifera TaxID=397392 RepID=UPI0025AE6A25|nr:uncharacterized protein LOC131156713 [Malania oleifera]
MAADTVKESLAKTIQLADKVAKTAAEAKSFRQQCSELKYKAQQLARLLRQAARASNDLYDSPTRRITDRTKQVLQKALHLALKCRANSFIKRVLFTVIPNAAFRKTSSLLENSIGDVSWLLRVSSRDGGYLGLPPIAANEPILYLVWEQIAILSAARSSEDPSCAAESLASLARDSVLYCKIIIDEGAVRPLLKLAKKRNCEGQETAVRAIGHLGRDPESVERIVNAGVCKGFAKILKENFRTNVQAAVAWAISELAANHPNCQNHFAQTNVVHMLANFLSHETEESMKAMAARAIWKLAKGNSSICRSITESRGLSSLAALLGRGPHEVRFNSAMAVMEITAVAKQNPDFRRAAFKPSSPAAKAVLDQLLGIIENGGESELALLLPSIKAIGNLARTFRSTETRIIEPLVRLLGGREADEVSREAVVALTKFACTGNYLHRNHCNTIIEVGGIKHLIQLVYFGEQAVRVSALVLLCYISTHRPESEALGKEEVLVVLEWASKTPHLVWDPLVEALLPEAKGRLELYQFRGSIQRVHELIQ